MSASSAAFRTLIADCTTAIKAFQSSSSKYTIFRTVPSSSARSPAHKATSRTPLTLLLLDSSFNPPSLAHLLLATSALKATTSSEKRLVLLFSTHNADKQPDASGFAMRLAMMTLFADDILSHPSTMSGFSSSTYPADSVSTRTDSSSETAAHDEGSATTSTTSGFRNTPLEIDIALTSHPYYTDKSLAATASDLYPADAIHRHIIGYDTYVRFLDAKYYPSYTPPLSALEPFFDGGHGVHVALRPGAWGGEEEQRNVIARLGRGELEDQGGKASWSERVTVLNVEGAGGVSSTAIREAAGKGQWKIVEKMCTARVVRFIREQGVYADGKG